MVLDELCVSLDECSQTVTSTSRPVCERWSIADPVVPRMRGHITKSTSLKVNLTAAPARTTMVNKCRDASTQTEKKPSRGRRRQHTCPICRGSGHHARTCKNVLLDENRERADAFFMQTIQSGNVGTYLTSVSRRASFKHAKAVARRIQSCATEHGVELRLPDDFADGDGNGRDVSE